MAKQFQMEWLDIAIEEWGFYFHGNWTELGLCYYFKNRFGYDMEKIFESVLGEDNYMAPTFMNVDNWEIWGKPRVKFLKRMRAELNKMGYYS